MFNVEKLNDDLGKCIKLCVNESYQSIDIIFNLFSVILSACLLISVVSLSFDNDLNINARRLQPAHLVSCIIRGETAIFTLFITTALSDKN